MGYSRASKTESHDRIVKTASTRFRETGIDGVGVADLMKLAGLTHGGFYRHFTSREELVAEAIERALRDGGAAVSAIAEGKDARLSALIDAYLSVAHRDGPATSCAVATLAADVSRCGKRARAAYSRQVTVYLELLGKLVAGTRKSKRAKAIVALSALVGAVSIARAVNDETLSREILKTAADELKVVLG